MLFWVQGIVNRLMLLYLLSFVARILVTVLFCIKVGLVLLFVCALVYSLNIRVVNAD